MLESVDSDLDHVVHVNVFLLRMADFDEMNRAYVEMMGDHRPARTAIGVHELPKPGVDADDEPTAVTRKNSTVDPRADFVRRIYKGARMRPNNPEKRES